jgi:hypothetical protein
VSEHERILLLAAAAIDFPLSTVDADELEAHLRSCDGCRTGAEQLRGDAALIAALPSRQPADEVGRRILEAAMGRQRAGLRPIMLVAAAALLAAALLGAAIVGALLTRAPELPISIVPPSIPVTVPTASPSTPAPTPTIAPGETWQVVSLSGSPGMSGVVAGGPGWIGVGGGAWTSTDGRTWTPATVEGVEPCPGPAPCSGMTEVAAGVGGFVAIGEDPTALRAGRPQSGLIWHSTDGLTWTIVGSGPEFELGACIEGCPSMTDVAGGPSGFVAIGYRTGGAQVAWSSTDGRNWETIPGSAFAVKGSSVELSAVAAGPGGFVIAGALGPAGGYWTTERAAFWTSPDGRAWTRSGPATPSTPSTVPYTVVVGGPGFVAVGGCRDGDRPCATAWSSPDGTTWTQQTIDASESPRFGEAAASNGDRVIAFSDAGTVVWTSDDGIGWTRREVSLPALGIDAAAGGDRGFIAMGLDQAETGYFTWLSP